MWTPLSYHGQVPKQRLVPGSNLPVSDWEGLSHSSVLLQQDLTLISWGQASYDESSDFLSHCKEALWLPTRQALDVRKPARGLRNSPFSIHCNLFVVLRVPCESMSFAKENSPNILYDSIYIQFENCHNWSAVIKVRRVVTLL